MPDIPTQEAPSESLTMWPLTNPIEVAHCDNTLSCCTRSSD